MANIQITQLPNAGAITGTEAVPIVQNGVTVQTTTGAIAASPSQTQTFLTKNQEPTLPNSRALSGSTGIGLVDGGAQSTLQITLNRASGSLEAAGNGIIAKTGSSTVAPRTLTASGNGISVTNGDGVSGNPTFQLSGIAAAIANMSGTGMLAIVGGSTIAGRQITGTANQITVTDGNGSGNPTLSIANNVVLPGTEGVTLPFGTTAERPSPATNGELRYNTSTGTFEGYANGAWGAITTGTGVTSVGLVLPSDFTVTNSPVTSTGDLTATWASQTANYMLAAPNGSSGTPTFRAMVNADLPASGVTANTYGSTTAIPVITVNAKGVITGVTTAAITGGLVYQGSWNASTNTPTLASGVGTNGYYYVVSVAGSTNLDGITDWQVGDWAIFNGTAWQKIDQTNLVSSVNGQTGAVSIGYADLAGAIPTWNQNTTGTAAGLSATLAIASGGTGQTTANAAFNALAPSQTSNANKYLKTDGTNTSWATVADPAAATPTDDGLVYGLTQSTAATTYSGWANYVTPYTLFSGANAFFAQVPLTPPPGVDVIGDWNAWVNATVHVGDPIYGQLAGGSNLYYGVVTSITGGTGPSDPAFIYVSNPNSNPPVTYTYPTNFTYSSPATALNGNTSLGYQTNSNGGKNTIVGYGAGSSIVTGYNLTVVGYDSEPSSSSVGNEATFGNSTTTNTRLFGSLSMGGSSAGSSGQFLTSTGSGTAPTWTSTLPVANGGTNLTSYSAGDLLYASGTTTLSKLGIGTTNYVLTAGASAPQYVAQSTLSVGSATNATNATNTAITADSTNATNYLTFVSATTGNLGQLVNSSITCNPSTGAITGGISGGTF